MGQGPRATSRTSAAQGTQTLMRGLDLIDQVVDRPMRIAELADRLALNRTTTHRLAQALLERGYLAHAPRGGVSLGPKLLHLGVRAHQQIDIVQTARAHTEPLADRTGLCVFLAQRAGDVAFHLDRVPGRQRIEVATRPGDRRALAQTGLGKALLLDDDEENLVRLYVEGNERKPTAEEVKRWLAGMREHRAAGVVLHESEDAEGIRSIAAPIRGADGKIVAAISIVSAAQYLSDERMRELAPDVRRTAEAISRSLGA